MILKRNSKILLMAVCSLVIFGANTIDVSATRTDRVHDTLVSNLRVRKNPSVNSPIVYTLDKGKDLVYMDDNTKYVTENGVSRNWRNFAYPDLNQGKYTKNKLGWICTYDGANGTYVTSTSRTTFHGTQWIYNDKALTKKHKSIKEGTYLSDGYNGVRHDINDLNLWSIRTHDDNAQAGDYPKTRYFNGWMANAAK